MHINILNFDLPFNRKAKKAAGRVVELCLCHYDVSQFLPSVQAASAFSYAVNILHPNLRGLLENLFHDTHSCLVLHPLEEEELRCSRSKCSDSMHEGVFEHGCYCNEDKVCWGNHPTTLKDLVIDNDMRSETIGIKEHGFDCGLGKERVNDEEEFSFCKLEENSMRGGYDDIFVTREQEIFAEDFVAETEETLHTSDSVQDEKISNVITSSECVNSENKHICCSLESKNFESNFLPNDEPFDDGIQENEATTSRVCALVQA